jgi:hypothetical protein
MTNRSIPSSVMKPLVAGGGCWLAAKVLVLIGAPEVGWMSGPAYRPEQHPTLTPFLFGSILVGGAFLFVALLRFSSWCGRVKRRAEP